MPVFSLTWSLSNLLDQRKCLHKKRVYHPQNCFEHVSVFWNANPSLLQNLVILSFFFHKNIFYKNLEAEVCEILRIF